MVLPRLRLRLPPHRLLLLLLLRLLQLQQQVRQQPHKKKLAPKHIVTRNTRFSITMAC